MELDLRREVIVGTGGIGSGILMRLEGDHTLGREESRAVKLLEGRDYCKLHIVFHYVQRLLGEDFPVIPIGKVGSDDAGRRLLDEMASVGMRLHHVQTVEGKRTLFAVAFSYPNGNGGNLTTVDSASDDVMPEDIRAAAKGMSLFHGPGIAVALPEVPLNARRELLSLGGELNFLRVASFVSGEAAEVISTRMLENVDVVVVNRDEAEMFTGIGGEIDDDLATRSIERFLDQNDGLSIVITAGSHGSWSWDGNSVRHAPALPASVRNTAGAGDAHLAGIVTATACGIGLHEANRFGSLIGAMKVSSVHTINSDITAASVLAESKRARFELPGELQYVLGRTHE